MLDITLEQIEYALGAKGKKISNEYLFPCPVCRQAGQDRKGNNLSFNPAKGLLVCFSCGQGHQVLKMINNKTKTWVGSPSSNISTQPVRANKWEHKDNKSKYAEYQYLANRELLNDKKLLSYLLENRKIGEEIIEFSGLGYDPTENKWVIPIYSIKYNTLVGFKYRSYDFKDKWSEKGSPATMMKIKYQEQTENLYICEGEFDSYIMYQILKKYNKLDASSIISPSNGVGTLINCIQEIYFNNYRNIYLCLDNDAAGLQVTQALLMAYPFMQDKTPQFTDPQLLQGHTDLNDWYKLNIA